jgi:predicted polyphosphate/ATP-dependent NAD kinase
MRVGLIVNPIAGIGGRVGLKGSDEVEIQRKAIDLGAEPVSELRARAALQVLLPLRQRFELVTAPGDMGELAARQMHFETVVLGSKPAGEPTSAWDTIQAAREMLALPVDLLLFCGGDGTARDVFSAVGEKLPALGIPAGVKMYSGVFASRPEAAGEIAAAMIRKERIQKKSAEVIDLDEESYRLGKISTRLYGALLAPYKPRLLQNQKAPSPAAEPARLQAIAESLREMMEPGWLYITGPGTTTRAFAERLGFPKTLVGVDVYSQDEVIAVDANERRLLELIDDRPAKIIVTPTGGSGFLFGRGNQQIAPSVLQKVGRDNIIVISLVEKLNALQGSPLLVDSGDDKVDQMLSGYISVISGYREKLIYRVST